MKNRILSFLIFLLSITSVMAQRESSDIKTKRFTLEECIAYGLENNLTIRSVTMDQTSSQLNLQKSKNDRLPTVSASASQSLGYSNQPETGGGYWQGNYSVNAGLTLYQGGYLNKLIKQSSLQTTLAGLQIEQSGIDLSLQIVQSFLSVLMNQELLTYQKVVLKTSEEQMIQGKEQFEVGKILESDYLLLQSQFVTDQSNVENTDLAIRNSMNTLENLLSLNSAESLEVIYPDSVALSKKLEIPGLDELISQTMSFLPSLKMKDASIKMADNEIGIAKTSFLPSLDLSASVGTAYANENGSFGTQLNNGLGEQLSLGLNIPVYNRNKTRTQVKLAEIALEQAELERDQQVLDVVNEIEKQYRNVITARNKHQASEVKKNAYLASYEVYNEQFTQGSITAVDLLQQQTNYLNALNDYLQNKYSFVLSRKILDIYMNVKIEL
jgi:outer membrane protein